MANSEEEDYLSDKFLTAPSTSTQTQTYADIRKQARKRADLRNVQNRHKSRRQLEQESREEGLNKSLFERAQEEKETIGVENKAMAMMMKMGFKPGQSLGKIEDDVAQVSSSTSIPDEDTFEETQPHQSGTKIATGHRKVPLSVDIWVGPLIVVIVDASFM